MSTATKTKTTTEANTKTEAVTEDPAARLMTTIEETEQTALEAVRKFVDTVDGVFPDLVEDGPRRKIIDSAFSMVEQLVSASNQLARNVVDVTEKALKES